jgi:AcrR family transcriptional regulator
MARTRSPVAHDKVLEAAIALFAERGIDAASMDAIAEASGVSKATIYKHWSNKDSLCLEALSYLFGGDSKHAVADTGDLRADLVARLSHQPAEDRRQIRERIMPHVIAYAAKNHAFGKAWRSQAMAPLTTALTDWIHREQARKQLKDAIDLECAIAMLVGPLIFRNIFKREPGSRKVYAPNLESFVAEAFLALFAT